MGMSIEEARYLIEHHKPNDVNNAYELGEAFCVAIDTMRKYQMMQADYKARLKADLVAVCTELQIEFEKNTVRWYVGRVDGKSDDVVLMETINDIIQQKINKLKGE